MRSTDEGVKVTVRPVTGLVAAERVTVSLNPELTRVRVAEPVAAELKVTLAGFKPIVKETTVTRTVTECVRAPLVPVMITEYVPGTID